MAFVNIAQNKRHLTRANGQPFFIMGCNYEGYFDRAWRMWDDGKFDPDLIRRDFDKMAASGLNMVRLFVLPALDADLRAGKFDKLDRVLQIAADHNQLVLLTFNDAHYLDLSYVAALDVKIAERYQDDPIIAGWDLENKPRYYNLAAATYPAGSPAPLQTSALVDHYGVLVSQQEAIELQQQNRIPRQLSPILAFYYINGLYYFIDFADDAGRWVGQNGGSVVDYMYSNDSAHWHKLIEVLDGTIAAWLDARHTPVRQADPNHMITTGYNWIYFAGLPANRRLDFQQYHKYGSADVTGFNQILSDLAGLQAVFPDHPLAMGEFGYSNQTNADPATSQPVSFHLTGLFETALLAYMRANDLAGGLKWMLNDVDTTSNPYEASFGIYGLNNSPKPIQWLLARFQQDWVEPPLAEKSLRIVQDPKGVALRFDLGDKTLLSGGIFQDESYIWRADDIAHCFIDRQTGYLDLFAQGDGQFAVDPWEVISNWDRNREAVLFRLVNDNPLELASFPPQERITWQVSAGVTYRLGLGRLIEPPPEPEPEVVPNPGEHVVLLPNSDTALQLALPYIRHFAPDISFAPSQVAGRWPYVTVIASEQEIPESVLAEIRASGAQIVDRIDDDAGAVLADLIARERRFLSSPPDTPPQDSPTDPPEDTPLVEIYTVQPGDTLSRIALQFYGQSSLWPIIYEANRDILDSPSLIRPGMQLKIPPPPE